MLWVLASVARKSSTSAMSTAVFGPSDTTVEKPTPFFCAQSRIDEVSAPDCDTNASGPVCAKGPGHAGVEVGVGPLEAQAVGTEQVDAIALGHLVHFRRQRGVNAGGNDHGCLALDAPGNFQGAQHLLVGQGNHGQVRVRGGQVGQGAGESGVQEKQVAIEVLRFQGLEQGLRMGREAGRIVLLAGKNGNGLGREQGGKVVLVHGEAWLGLLHRSIHRNTRVSTELSA